MMNAMKQLSGQSVNHCVILTVGGGVDDEHNDANEDEEGEKDGGRSAVFVV